MIDKKELSKLMSLKRFKTSTVKRQAKIENFYSDRSRIIYSSSFRRLQQKAQVFSLESNASVRTRMTHSLEVADIGRTLSNQIALGLLNKKLITVRDMPILVAIVENACLLHDIGNPPFGHFGETAIKDWANKYLVEIAENANIKKDDMFNLLICDFKEFDGNPQGFRLITRLHTERDAFGLNLSYATLLCSLKYVRAAGEEKDDGIRKKAGYFQSEKSLVEQIYKDIGRNRSTRFPLTYIMEAADDISYCLSDISDGIEKRIITIDDFIKNYNNIWEENYKNEKSPVPFPKPEEIVNFSLSFAIPWSKIMTEAATNNYINNYQKFYEGKEKQLIPEDGVYKVLKTIKQVSRKTLYSSIEAESIELTGYAVITGILKHYQRLLELSCEDFNKLLDNKSKLDYERRLFNLLGKRYLKAYQNIVDEYHKKGDFKLKEWHARIHLVIDHISGMTDEFALNTYQMLEGIDLLRV